MVVNKGTFKLTTAGADATAAFSFCTSEEPLIRHLPWIAIVTILIDTFQVPRSLAVPVIPRKVVGEDGRLAMTVRLSDDASTAVFLTAVCLGARRAGAAMRLVAPEV